MEEYRVYGPPGTGKTSWIAKMATRDIDKYGPDQVSICSLTNAAVREASGRDIPIDMNNLTTLHARCKRSLEAPPPAEAYMKDFAEAHPLYATGNYIPIKGSQRGEDRAEIILSSGPTIYDMVQMNRQRMIPINEWRPVLRKWYEIWSQWCVESGLMDYASWLEVARDTRSLPAQSVVYVDEAQDHTPLQLSVIRSWDTRKLVLVGDDDQSLYEWSGSIPEAFLEPHISEAQEMILSKSYRVPRRTHRLAMDIISRVSYRKEKIYDSTDEEGSIFHSQLNLTDSHEWLMSDVGDGKEHMIIVSCAYMLEGIIDQFKHHGIPFHNPYRRSNSRWNPLYTETAIAARSYLLDAWTGDAILRWIDLIRPDVFDAKEGLARLCQEHSKDEISYDTLRPYLKEHTAEVLLSRREEALIELKRNVPGLWDYYGKVFKGGQVVPKVIIGTIHSVKGGECDTVHVFPDLSAQGHQQILSNYDRLHRLFYTAITRAKRLVVIHNPGNYGPMYDIERGESDGY